MVPVRDPWPLRVLGSRSIVLYLFLVGVALYALVTGTTLGRIFGGVLLLACLMVGWRVARRYTGRKTSK
jgi:hypothetical protein